MTTLKELEGPRNLVKASQDTYLYGIQLTNGTTLIASNISAPKIYGNETWYDIIMLKPFTITRTDEDDVLCRETVTVNSKHIMYVVDAQS